MPTPGEQVDRFLLLTPLGSGGQGEVWRAVDQARNGAFVALKLLDLRVAGAAEAERLRREARTLARLAHPAVVGCHALFEDFGRGLLGVALDLVDGVPLSEAALDHRLDRATAHALLIHIADGLAFLHREGLVHRDLKPENVLVSPTFWASPSEPGHVKLIDFGISVTSGNPQPLTSLGHLIGTPSFMAPESLDPTYWRTPGSVPSVDVFALGVLGWQLLYGDHPTGLPSGARLEAYAHAYRGADQAPPPWPPVVQNDALESALRSFLSVCAPQRPPDGAAALALLRGEPLPPPETSLARSSSLPRAASLTPPVASQHLPAVATQLAPRASAAPAPPAPAPPAPPPSHAATVAAAPLPASRPASPSFTPAPPAASPSFTPPPVSSASAPPPVASWAPPPRSTVAPTVMAAPVYAPRAPANLAPAKPAQPAAKSPRPTSNAALAPREKGRFLPFAIGCFAVLGGLVFITIALIVFGLGWLFGPIAPSPSPPPRPAEPPAPAAPARPAATPAQVKPGACCGGALCTRQPSMPQVIARHCPRAQSTCNACPSGRDRVDGDCGASLDPARTFRLRVAGVSLRDQAGNLTNLGADHELSIATPGGVPVVHDLAQPHSQRATLGPTIDAATLASRGLSLGLRHDGLLSAAWQLAPAPEGYRLPVLCVGIHTTYATPDGRYEVSLFLDDP